MIIRLSRTLFFDTTGKSWDIRPGTKDDGSTDEGRCQIVIRVGFPDYVEVLASFRADSKYVAGVIASKLSENPGVAYIDLTTELSQDSFDDGIGCPCVGDVVACPNPAEVCLDEETSKACRAFFIEETRKIEEHPEVQAAKVAGVPLRSIRIVAARAMLNESSPDTPESNEAISEGLVMSLFENGGEGKAIYVP